MTFKLKPNPTFRATVEISQPGEGAEPIRVPLDFRHLSRVQYRTELEEPKLTVDAAVRLLVVGWGVPEVEFTRERFEEFLDDHPVAAVEIYTTWVRESRESKRKN